MTEKNTKDNILEYEDSIELDTEVVDPEIRPEIAYDTDGIRYSITSFGKDIDVDGYYKRLKNGSIYRPEYQRKFVWKTARSSMLIESLFIGLPVPQIFFFEEADGKWSIIDGLQRLTTIRRFYDDDFSLKAPGLLPELRGKKYSQLTPSQASTIGNATLRAVVLRQDKPEKDNSSVYELFHRINTQSSPLSAQEIRSCISRGKLNELLVELNQNVCWRTIFGSEHSRLKDRELILRFISLHFAENYKPPMTKFLDGFMENQKNPDESYIEQYRKTFTETIELIHSALGADAFRPKPENRALILTNYDAVMHGIACSIEKGSEISTEQVKEFSENLLKNKNYLYGTEEFTNDKDRVEARLKGAEEILESIL